MAFVSTELEYQEISERFVQLFPGDVSDYFNTNWNQIHQSWACYALNQVICYGETTNNKLESKNGFIKALINSSDNLDSTPKAVSVVLKNEALARRKFEMLKVS